MYEGKKSRAFDHPMKLHCSQTLDNVVNESAVFDHPMKLHCSQTTY